MGELISAKAAKQGEWGQKMEATRRRNVLYNSEVVVTFTSKSCDATSPQVSSIVRTRARLRHFRHPPPTHPT